MAVFQTGLSYSHGWGDAESEDCVYMVIRRTPKTVTIDGPLGRREWLGHKFRRVRLKRIKLDGRGSEYVYPLYSHHVGTPILHAENLVDTSDRVPTERGER